VTVNPVWVYESPKLNQNFVVEVPEAVGADDVLDFDDVLLVLEVLELELALDVLELELALDVLELALDVLVELAVVELGRH